MSTTVISLFALLQTQELSNYLTATFQARRMLRRLTFKCKVTKIVLVMSLRYTPLTQSYTVLHLFNVCSNHATLKYSGQKSTNNLQFIILTYL